MSDDNEKRIVMTREIARRWILKTAHAEYRFQVYGSGNMKHLPGLMKSLRDGRVAMSGVPAIPDLGIQEGFDSVELWSSNREALVKLEAWFDKRGYMTTGIW